MKWKNKPKPEPDQSRLFPSPPPPPQLQPSTRELEEKQRWLELAEKERAKAQDRLRTALERRYAIYKQVHNASVRAGWLVTTPSARYQGRLPGFAIYCQNGVAFIEESAKTDRAVGLLRTVQNLVDDFGYQTLKIGEDFGQEIAAKFQRINPPPEGQSTAKELYEGSPHRFS